MWRDMVALLTMFDVPTILALIRGSCLFGGSAVDRGKLSNLNGRCGSGLGTTDANHQEIMAGHLELLQACPAPTPTQAKTPTRHRP